MFSSECPIVRNRFSVPRRDANAAGQAEAEVHLAPTRLRALPSAPAPAQHTSRRVNGHLRNRALLGARARFLLMDVCVLGSHGDEVQPALPALCKAAQCVDGKDAVLPEGWGLTARRRVRPAGDTTPGTSRRVLGSRWSWRRLADCSGSCRQQVGEPSILRACTPLQAVPQNQVQALDKRVNARTAERPVMAKALGKPWTRLGNSSSPGLSWWTCDRSFLGTRVAAWRVAAPAPVCQATSSPSLTSEEL